MRIFCVLIFLFAFNNAFAQQSMNVRLLGNWNDTAHVRPNLVGQRYNDVWGFVLRGKEYAVIGSTEGAHIIDIDQCRQVAFYPGKATGNLIIHRDYKVYKHYLYAVCNEGLSSMQVFDLNYLPDSLHLVYESSPFDFMGANKIFIDTNKAMLYAGTPKTYSSTDNMRIYDISDPENPVLKLRYNNHDNIHDMYVRNDTAFCSASFYGYEVVDFNKPNNGWQEIGEMHFYPYQGFNHSNWINERGIGVMTDETYGSPVKVIDVRDLNNVHVLGFFSPRPGDSTCIPHIPYLIGNLAFVAYYFDGLQIYDISDSASPQRIGYYDTYPAAAFSGFGGAWGCYPFFPSGRVVVSDMQTGLYVFDVSAATGWKRYTTEFSVYPNPATDQLFIEFPYSEDAASLDLRIFDVTGKMVFRQTFATAGYAYQPIQLTLPGNWPAGTYFIKIVTGGREHLSKFTKL